MLTVAAAHLDSSGKPKGHGSYISASVIRGHKKFRSRHHGAGQEKHFLGHSEPGREARPSLNPQEWAASHNTLGLLACLGASYMSARFVSGFRWAPAQHKSTPSECSNTIEASVIANIILSGVCYGRSARNMEP